MLYAIVKSGDKQFRVEKGMRINVPALEAEPGDAVDFNDVLLCSNGDDVVVGTPLVQDAQVKATCMGDVKGEKLVVFKMKRRKKYRRKTGHRQTYTSVRIDDIIAPVAETDAPDTSEPVTSELPEDAPVITDAGAEQEAHPAPTDTVADAGKNDV